MLVSVDRGTGHEPPRTTGDRRGLLRSPRYKGSVQFGGWRACWSPPVGGLHTNHRGARKIGAACYAVHATRAPCNSEDG